MMFSSIKFLAAAAAFASINLANAAAPDGKYFILEKAKLPTIAFV